MRGKAHKPRAIDAYRRFLDKQYPHDTLASDALYGLGVAEEDTGQAAAAEATYTRFLQGYPQHAAGRRSRHADRRNGGTAQHSYAEAEQRL